jgi:hypothetical protein
MDALACVPEISGDEPAFAWRITQATLRHSNMGTMLEF